MHTPVLLEQAIEALDVKQGGLYIDATAGEGGHVRKIVEKGGTVLALDWDEKQVENLQKIFTGNEAVTVIRSNYADIENAARANGFGEVDGVLFDYGLSMKQLSESKRGFSFRQLEDPLDMRIGPEAPYAASDLLNTIEEPYLYEIFAKYGEEYHSQLIAKKIIVYRHEQKFEKVKHLNEAIDEAIRACQEKHGHEPHKMKARIFQALRIFVNSEFDSITAGLEGALKITKKNGRIAVITFHSLEDRLVKQYIRKNNLKTVTKKAVQGDENISFERSAKLRVIVT